jgi:hypothetical protein
MRSNALGTTTGALCLAFAAVLLSACGGKDRLGQPIPSEIAAVKLGDILEAPADYKDREVLLEGTYSSYCCPSDFSYKEGLDAIEIAPVGFASPKADRGRPLRVYGVVRVGEKRAEEEAEGESEEEGVHHGVYVEAKGLEFR